jgi:8-oxo-dGTP pyrophosphatase MutT (NUDIX family)
MLRKNSKIHFGGMWVFPGGRVDPEDRVSPHPTDHLGAFKIAAVREAQEEAGIDLAGADLHHFSHWLPPAIRPKRFSTHFFLAEAPSELAEVAIDDQEIVDHSWVSAHRALERRTAGEIEFVTPTFVTLDWLRRHDSVSSAIADVAGPVCYHTHIKPVSDGMIAVYEGDVAYVDGENNVGDLDEPGPRRRCYMLDSAWWWEEHDGAGNGPSPAPAS